VKSVVWGTAGIVHFSVDQQDASAMVGKLRRIAGFSAAGRQGFPG
jgi:hypothetical protein